MTGDDDLDRASWDRRWTQVSREHPDKLAKRRASAHLLTETAHLHPGRALDAGRGHGAEALWLASRGWRVTAVDYSVAALAIARSRAKGPSARTLPGASNGPGATSRRGRRRGAPTSS